jgi:3-oxochol-4-en-24-oyl-CoA dehydrogenase
MSSLALNDDHRALGEVARSFLEERGARADARAALNGVVGLPAWWPELCRLGWAGLHLPESVGGQGYTMLELAVVVEEMGRVVAPGPFLATVWASAVIDGAASDELRLALLPALADGSRIGAVSTGAPASGATAPLRRVADGTVHGTVDVLSGVEADVLMLTVGDDLVVIDRDAAGMTVTATDSFDPTRRVARVVCTGVAVDERHVLAGAADIARHLGAVLVAAEAAGAARACTEMAVEYAKTRIQFGRPIGSFQAVKHRCAEMLVDTELAAAAAWDAARVDPHADAAVLALVASIAAAQTLPAFERCARTSVQVHGGIGYTWEHDAHLYLRRAASVAALFGGRSDAARSVAELVAAGVRRPEAVELPPEADDHRAEARTFRQRYDALPAHGRRGAFIDSGYAVPHWPRPWGRGAGVVEQLVIDEELGDLPGLDLGIGTWVVLTLVQHGSEAQRERWIRPSLDGTLRWCQLFSEPGAGSDAAAISTRAVRVDGGWLVNGQKVWTSDAHTSNRGLATVRTDPDAPKHAGVTMVAIDMKAPGVEVRPLREITGETLFNEVFFDDVLVPDDDVVGEVNAGWTVARATLGNERVSIGGNRNSLGVLEAVDLLALAARHAPDDRSVLTRIGVLLAERQSMRMLNLRQITRAIAGGPPGPEGNVTKLLSAEHTQRVTELALDIVGSAAVNGDEARIARDYLFSRCLTIAGGTSEIVRSLIGERILGLPRDPLQR